MNTLESRNNIPDVGPSVGGFSTGWKVVATGLTVAAVIGVAADFMDRPDHELVVVGAVGATKKDVAYILSSKREGWVMRVASNEQIARYRKLRAVEPKNGPAIIQDSKQRGVVQIMEGGKAVFLATDGKELNDGDLVLGEYGSVLYGQLTKVSKDGSSATISKTIKAVEKTYANLQWKDEGEFRFAMSDMVIDNDSTTTAMNTKVKNYGVPAAY